MTVTHATKDDVNETLCSKVHKDLTKISLLENSDLKVH